MGRINYEVCDRCGNKINDSGWPITRINKLKEVAVFGYGPHNYCNCDYVLCDKCSVMFRRFMRDGKFS